MSDFGVGVNLPWLDYGQDFGASAWRPRGGVAQPERRQRMREALDRVAQTGARLVPLNARPVVGAVLLGMEQGGLHPGPDVRAQLRESFKTS